MALRSELIAKISANSSGLRKDVGGISSFVTGAVAGIAAAFAAAFSIEGLKRFVGMASEVQKGMAEVNTIARVSQSRLAELEKGIMKLGTELGVTAEDGIQGLYDALSASVPQENVLEFLKVASKAAIAGVSDTGTAVDALTSVINSYGMDTSDATRVSDVFFEAIRLGKTTFDELAEGIGQVAPLAATMGVSIEELGGLISTLTKKGLDTSTAITQIRGTMVAIAKPTEAMAALLAKLNEKYGEAAIKALSWQDKLQLIRKESGGSAEAMAKLFGRVQALNGAIGVTGDSAATAASDLAAMRDAAGSTDKAFRVMSKTFDTSMRKLVAGAKGAATTVGAELLPVLQEEIEKLLTKLVTLQESGDLAKWGKEAAKTLNEIIDSVKSLASFISENAQLLKTIGFSLAGAKIMTVLIGTITGITNAVKLLGTQTAKTGVQTKAMSGALMGIQFAVIGAGVASLIKLFHDLKAAAEEVDTALQGVGKTSGLYADEGIIGKNFGIWLEKLGLIEGEVLNVEAALLKTADAANEASTEMTELQRLEQIEASKFTNFGELTPEGIPIEDAPKEPNKLSQELDDLFKEATDFEKSAETDEEFRRLAEIVRKREALKKEHRSRGDEQQERLQSQQDRFALSEADRLQQGARDIVNQAAGGRAEVERGLTGGLGRVGGGTVKGLRDLIKQFGKAAVTDALGNVGRLPGGTGGAQTPGTGGGGLKGIDLAFANIDLIAKKVDKMAGLTGN